MKIEIVSFRQLSAKDLAEINQFRLREFGVEIPVDSTSPNEDQTELYFLLKDEQSHLLGFAMVEELALKFRDQSALVLCVSTVIATQKGKGYGAQMLAEIQTYAKEKGRTLVGFCETDMIPYYKKRDFEILNHELNQFVYIDESDEIIPKIVPGEVFYLSGNDQVIEQILSGADKTVKIHRKK